MIRLEKKELFALGSTTDLHAVSSLVAFMGKKSEAPQNEGILEDSSSPF